MERGPISVRRRPAGEASGAIGNSPACGLRCRPRPVCRQAAETSTRGARGTAYADGGAGRSGSPKNKAEGAQKKSLPARRRCRVGRGEKVLWAHPKKGRSRREKVPGRIESDILPEEKTFRSASERIFELVSGKACRPRRTGRATASGRRARSLPRSASAWRRHPRARRYCPSPG